MRATVGTKIIGGVIGTIVLLLIVVIVGFAITMNIHAEYKDMVGQQQLLYKYISDLRLNQIQEINDLNKFIITQNRQYVTTYRETSQAQNDNFQQVEKLLTTENSRSGIAGIKQADAEFKQEADEIISEAGQHHEGNFVNSFNAHETRFENLYSHLVNVVDEEIRQENQSFNNRENKANAIIISVVAIVVVISVLWGWFVSKTISRPVKQLALVAGRVSTGVLNVDIPDVKGNDEIKDLAKAFQKMITSLKELLENIRQASEQISTTSSHLKESSDISSTATQQVAAAMNDVAQGVNEQTVKVTETAGVVEQTAGGIQQIATGAHVQARDVAKAAEIVDHMAVVINNVIESTSQVAQAAENSDKAAYEGQVAMKNTIEGMERIKSKVHETGNRIQELGRLSREIGEIVQLIDEIADQTNLLALNAAIEAARAGEHGKGFAVVADEVRKLAERSSGATKDIAQLITGIQTDTHNAIVAMEDGIKEVEEGNQLAAEADISLQNIIKNVELTNQQVKNISVSTDELSVKSSEVVSIIDTVAAVAEENSASTEQMAAGTEQMKDAINNIARIAENSAAATQEVSASTYEVSVTAQTIADSAVRLNELAEKLLEQTNQFTM